MLLLCKTSIAMHQQVFCNLNKRQFIFILTEDISSESRSFSSISSEHFLSACSHRSFIWDNLFWSSSTESSSPLNLDLYTFNSFWSSFLPISISCMEYLKSPISFWCFEVNLVTVSDSSKSFLSISVFNLKLFETQVHIFSIKLYNAVDLILNTMSISQLEILLKQSCNPGNDLSAKIRGGIVVCSVLTLLSTIFQSYQDGVWLR